MPHKSRRHAKYMHGKRGKSRKGFSAPAQAIAVAQRYEPAPQTGTGIPRVKVPTPRVAVAPPVNVSRELRRIGILAGILLVVLVLASLVLG